MSAIFYQNDEQRKLGLETKAFEENQRNQKIHIEIVPYGKFYPVEDDHQKYELRRYGDLMKEFKAMYPRDIDFVNLTAAARINGYIGGHGKPEAIKNKQVLLRKTVKFLNDRYLLRRDVS